MVSRRLEFEGVVDVGLIVNISSWDGYLLELARSLNIKKIYTIDEELKRRAKFI